MTWRPAGRRCRGTRRCRTDHAIRREHVRDADRGRGEGFSLDDYRTDASALARPLPYHPIRPGRRDHGHGSRGLTPAAVDPRRFGVYLGSGEGQQDFPSFVDLVHRSTTGGEVDKASSPGWGWTLHPTREAEQEPGTPAGYLAGVFGARGHNATCLTACAASGPGDRRGGRGHPPRRGRRHLAGGTHSMIHPFGLTGFILLTAMSTRNDDPARASRPFDRDRDGFLLGEGGGMLVLEELEHARARGAVIHGEIGGHARRPTPSA